MIYTQGKWFIAFFNGIERRWWDVFTRPNFRHCFAMRYVDELDAWQVVDWGSEGLFIEIAPKRMVDAIIVGVNAVGGCFLEFDARRGTPRLFPFRPLYCVSAIKELIGLRDWRIITPWHLYCALMKRGARRMFDLSHIKEDEHGRNNVKTEISEAGPGAAETAA